MASVERIYENAIADRHKQNRKHLCAAFFRLRDARLCARGTFEIDVEGRTRLDDARRRERRWRRSLKALRLCAFERKRRRDHGHTVYVGEERKVDVVEERRAFDVSARVCILAFNENLLEALHLRVRLNVNLQCGGEFCRECGRRVRRAFCKQAAFLPRLAFELLSAPTWILAYFRVAEYRDEARK